IPQVAGLRIEGQAKAVADAEGEDLLEVGADLAIEIASSPCNSLGPGRKERVVGRRAAVVVQPQDDAAEVRVVRLWAAELVVGHVPSGDGGAGQSGAAGPVRKILHLAAPAVVPEDDVEVAVRPGTNHAAIV